MSSKFRSKSAVVKKSKSLVSRGGEKEKAKESEEAIDFQLIQDRMKRQPELY